MTKIKSNKIIIVTGFLIIFSFMGMFKTSYAYITFDPAVFGRQMAQMQQFIQMIEFAKQQVNAAKNAAKNIDSLFSSSQLNSLQQASQTLSQAQQANQYIMQAQKFNYNDLKKYIRQFNPSQKQWNTMTFSQQQTQMITNTKEINDDISKNIGKLKSYLDTNKKYIKENGTGNITETGKKIQAQGESVTAVLQAVGMQLTNMTNLTYENKQIMIQMSKSIDDFVQMENQLNLRGNANEVNSTSTSMSISNTGVSLLNNIVNN